MKPTRARLRNYVKELKESVEKEIRAKKTNAIRTHIEAEWLKIDPEFKKLRSYFESLETRQKLKNELVDLLEENNLEMWSLCRGTDVRDFDTRKDHFLDRLRYGSIEGLAKIEAAYNREINEVRETYDAIVANVERVPVKQGVAYLKELGINVDIFKEEEAQLPMITVDKSKLRLPSETADNK
ncbi:hypothetical protein ABVF54_12640 [Enterococcus mundtii]|uniref:hypothetical protein n=1 Tax=Enterococcus mundtii TaxID=53346 RepID=UPI00129CB3D9|nr:hypothetical protein [Enterococcus mundtii]MRI74082.1 hypothetical protein [Enterococcus mundtii]